VPAYAVARWIGNGGRSEGLDSSRLAVAGDSVGGNMTAALAILAKQRGDVMCVHQSLYYPVTDAGQDTDSYREFADGPFLTAKGMAWFWDCYLPDRESARDHDVASAGDDGGTRGAARGLLDRGRRVARRGRSPTPAI
jgi:acetyl esterase